MADLEQERQRMLDAHLRARRIHDARVLAAFGSVRRDDFVGAELREMAYDDVPLPIGDGQTISQPYIVAFTVQELALRETDRVLDVGTGSGYAAAIMSRVAASVRSVERIGWLAESARERLARLGFDNIEVKEGDGSIGWPESAPFDAIAVGAGGPRVPEALKNQLALGGRLVMPVGDDEVKQTLRRITRLSETRFVDEALADVRFVPLIGAQAWSA